MDGGGQGRRQRSVLVERAGPSASAGFCWLDCLRQRSAPYTHAVQRERGGGLNYFLFLEREPRSCGLVWSCEREGGATISGTEHTSALQFDHFESVRQSFSLNMHHVVYPVGSVSLRGRRMMWSSRNSCTVDQELRLARRFGASCPSTLSPTPEPASGPTTSQTPARFPDQQSFSSYVALDPWEPLSSGARSPPPPAPSRAAPLPQPDSTSRDWIDLGNLSISAGELAART